MTAMILLAAITPNMIEMMIGVPEVAIKAIKGAAMAEEGVVAVVIPAAVDSTREVNSKAGQEEKILVLMNGTLSKYFALFS
jgi:hypothetical protein